MLDRGKLAVLAIFALALTAAGVAWWFNYSRGQRTLEFYGRDAALLIRTAPQVELLRLAPVEEISAGGETLSFGGSRRRVIDRIDISQAKGLIHARTSLLADSSYEWSTGLSDCQSRTDLAVRFTGRTSATLVFDFACRRVWYAEYAKPVTLIPKVAEGWQSFLGRHSTESPSPSAKGAGGGGEFAPPGGPLSNPSTN
jgi:hypothetical protein